MSGDYQPGAVLSQVELARNYGVSRTPLREAMRRLEAEGLIEALQNQRARVATVDAEALDVMFTERVLVEAMGVKVTVPFVTEVDLNGVLAATAALRIAFERDPAAVDGARRSLHQRYVARAGPRLRSTIAEQFDCCERYRRMYGELTATVLEDYAAVASACIARDAAAAILRIAQLEARLARAVIARVNERYEAIALRSAIQMLGGTH